MKGGRYPFAVTVTLAVKDVALSAVPVIFHESSDGSTVELDPLACSWAISLSQYVKFSTVLRSVQTLCRFINFSKLFGDGSPQSVDEQTALIFTYLDYRRAGTENMAAGHPLRPLEWKPVSRNTIRIEFTDLIRFFQFIEETGAGETRALGNKILSLPRAKLSTLAKAQLSSRDMLVHLNKSRSFWEKHRSTSTMQMPSRGRITPTLRTVRPFPPKSEVDLIIEREANPAFRALWLVLAYGGSHRVSEMLNLWQADVLPGEYRSEFFGSYFGDEGSLVLIAHPTDSTYLGDFQNKRKLTREAFMIERYGFRPRSTLPNRHKLYAGFKTKVLSGLHSTADTYWLSKKAAQQFDECADEIRTFHLHNRTSRHHPYFFVNMLARDSHYGTPLKKSRVDAAWKAACKRVGIEPNVRGRNIQGLRHFTKAYAEGLGLSPRLIQVMRGDTNIQSQEDYGISIDALRTALKRDFPQERTNDYSGI
ncbi:hypothetical protein SAMN05444398_11614 [Roseovarius pacificus]|uniref:Phage integrase family protein n=1 Tax=Roseovarius pacificus TaxID=337701 RepID=A0A1M7IN81_9RHOB|nr:hypothetical protein [Roseovarius pacificus]GGO61506.1 hypothetical protein GCM10011315_38360 [Roseovarius pacificus]SHM42262.1 hypothetical protein SAMN05444398_11614 [Roseovarius pacificus]